MNINLDDLLAKRREVVGSDRGFPVTFGGREFFLVAPELASAEWNDRWAAIQDDIADDVISSSSAREELASLILGDQADDFLTAAAENGIDPVIVISMALREHSEDVKKIRARRNSRPTRRR